MQSSKTVKEEKIRKSYFRPFLIGAAILTVLLSHFAISQFIAIESEKDSSVSELINKQPIVIKTRFEPNRTETVSVTSVVSPTVQAAPKIELKQAVQKETETIIRKKPARESRTERLRRAEKLLTGI